MIRVDTAGGRLKASGMGCLCRSIWDVECLSVGLLEPVWDVERLSCELLVQISWDVERH